MRAVIIIFVLITLTTQINSQEAGSIHIHCKPGVDIYVDTLKVGESNERDNGFIIYDLPMKKYWVILSDSASSFFDDKFLIDMDYYRIDLYSVKFNNQENLDEIREKRYSDPSIYFPVDYYPIIRIDNKPPYPHKYKNKNRHDTLTVKALINEMGYIENMIFEKSTGIKELDSIGLIAASSYVFKPAYSQYKPVSFWTVTNVIFDTLRFLEANEVSPQAEYLAFVDFPRLAYQAGMHGVITVDVLVSSDGSRIEYRMYNEGIITQSMEDITREAWVLNKYKAGTNDGKPANNWFRYQVHFINDWREFPRINKY